MVKESGRKILVVDDEEEILRLLERALARYGYETLCTSSALEAMVLLQDHPINLIVTDIRMQGIDGILPRQGQGHLRVLHPLAPPLEGGDVVVHVRGTPPQDTGGDQETHGDPVAILRACHGAFLP